MEQYQSLSSETSNEPFNFQEKLDSFLIHWKWILLSLIVCLFVSFIYLRYATPQYNATTTIIVRDDRKGGIQSELSAFSDLNIGYSKSNLENEIEILKSRNIVQKVIKKLGFNVSYFTEGRVNTIESYTNAPVNCLFFDSNEQFYNNYDSFKINGKNKLNFELFDGSKKKIGDFKYEEIIILRNTKLIVSKNLLNQTDNFSLLVNISKVLDVANSYKSKINIVPQGKNTTIVELTISDPIKEKAQDFLNEIVAVYNNDAIDDKNYISKKTITFIENRIKLIASELNEVEKGEEGYKKSNKLIDIKREGDLYLTKSSEIDKEIIRLETDLRINNTLSEYIKTMNSGDLLPNNVVNNDLNASALIAEYNAAILYRNRLLKESTNKNIVLENIDQKANDLLEAVNQSLNRSRINTKITKNDLEKQLLLNDGQISEIPMQSRELRIIERQQKIKEALYLYLLQKREETAISLAVTAPNAKVIDEAIFSNSPVSPQKSKIYLMAVLLGLIIPISLIFVLDLLDTKVKIKSDIQALTTIPFLGDIPKSKNSNIIVNSKDRSSAAEAIRIIRTNLEFLLGEVNLKKAKTIFVTSTIPKEGKTFVSVNLASTIASSNSKVLLIGLDIRNPQIEKYLDLPEVGISNFLAKNSDNIDQYIVKIKNYENFYVLPAGTIPPNPVELLMNNKIDTLFDELKAQFDYIIVDTAPVSLVTDTILIAKNADAFIYVARANYLDKRLLKIAETFYKEKKLPNMSILLNDTIWKKRYGYGYTYGYAYSYGGDKKSLFKRIKDKFSKT